jgi:hypothetical protein
MGEEEYGSPGWYAAVIPESAIVILHDDVYYYIGRIHVISSNFGNYLV